MVGREGFEPPKTLSRQISCVPKISHRHGLYLYHSDFSMKVFRYLVSTALSNNVEVPTVLAYLVKDLAFTVIPESLL